MVTKQNTKSKHFHWVKHSSLCLRERRFPSSWPTGLQLGTTLIGKACNKATLDPWRGDGEESASRKTEREGERESARGISRHDKSNDGFVPGEGEGEAAQTACWVTSTPAAGRAQLKSALPPLRRGHKSPDTQSSELADLRALVGSSRRRTDSFHFSVNPLKCCHSGTVRRTEVDCSSSDLFQIGHIFL